MDRREVQRQRAAAARAARAKKLEAPKAHKPVGVIKADEMYRIDLIPEMFGIGRVTLRRAEREGLKIGWLGNHKFVAGAELIRFVNK